MDTQLQQLKRLAPWGGHKNGTVVTVDAVRAWQLLNYEKAEPYVPEKAGAIGRRRK